MSYQIRSTPFFKRMVSASKKSGQLQKLQEEYERLRVFNDHTIEMRMRKVRLQRLFKEIEDIKDTSVKRRNSHKKNKPPTNAHLERIMRSRELGKQYSSVNFDRRSSKTQNKSLECPKIVSKPDADRRALIAKSISYGNERSRRNLLKLASQTRRKCIKMSARANNLADQDELGEVEKEEFKQCLNYGKPLAIFPASGNLIKKPIGSSFSYDELTPETSSEIGLDDYNKEAIDKYKLLDFSDISTDDILNDNELIKKCGNKSSNEKWRKLIRLMRYSNKNKKKKPQSNMLMRANTFQLRSIPNDTNLPLSDITDCCNARQSASEPDTLYEEEFLNVSTLITTISASSFDSTIESNKKPNKVDDTEKMLCDAIGTSANEQEADDTTKITRVQELREIFERVY